MDIENAAREYRPGVTRSRHPDCDCVIPHIWDPNYDVIGTQACPGVKIAALRAATVSIENGLNRLENNDGITVARSIIQAGLEGIRDAIKDLTQG